MSAAPQLEPPHLRLVSEYTPPPRVPDELMTDGNLPDWAKLVWIAIRAVQGSNDSAWAFYEEYGARCGKSYSIVRKAVTALKKAGWLVELEPASRGSAPVLRCLWRRAEEAAEKGGKKAGRRREQGSHLSEKAGTGFSKRREQGSQSPTPPNKDESVQESEGDARAHEAGQDEAPSHFPSGEKSLSEKGSAPPASTPAGSGGRTPRPSPST